MCQTIFHTICHLFILTSLCYVSLPLSTKPDVPSLPSHQMAEKTNNHDTLLCCFQIVQQSSRCWRFVFRIINPNFLPTAAILMLDIHRPPSPGLSNYRITYLRQQFPRRVSKQSDSTMALFVVLAVLKAPTTTWRMLKIT